MNFIENVYEIAESFMIEPQWVKLNKNKIIEVSKIMKDVGIKKFEPPVIGDIFSTILYELIGCSVNYCYFYGKSNIRINRCNSTSMGKILFDSFKHFDKYSKEELTSCIDNFGKKLVLKRFPLIEERLRHLNELKEYIIDIAIEISLYPHTKMDINSLIKKIITSFPGFASDIFLKRTFLFFIQLYRHFGWFEKDLHNIPVPADYQIPKMLHFFNCIEYTEQLQNIIQHNQPIPKHSLQECEIRSATILAINKICELTGWNVADVDSWFFTSRHSCNDNFHLTVTTDY